MRNLIVFILFTLVLSLNVKGQDICSNAAQLCANNTIASTTFGATTSANDPALSCGDLTVNNNVWFKVMAFTNGICSITVGQIDNSPGLEMEIYTGACGALVSTGFCNSANGPAGSMNLTFPVNAGVLYHILVDGAAGNKEAFTIVATSPTNSIIGKPVPGFIPSSISGCVPLSVLLQNTTVTSGGTNLTYQWRINGGPFLNATGADTTILFNAPGYQIPVDLKVGNTECGFASATQYIDIEQLNVNIIPPPTVCIGTPAEFTGDAMYLPDPPFTTVNIVSWDWDFGDPASGANNTANGDTVQHIFVGPGTTFTVRLIVTSADCGSDTAYTIINANPKPVVNAGANQIICEGQSVALTAVTVDATSPVSYLWTGSGLFSCNTCDSTTVSNLLPGNNIIGIHIEDINGCFADSTVNVRVTPKPIVDAGNDTIVCNYSSVQLNANITTGTPPFTYSWFPATGLNNSTIKNPVAYVTSPVTYCVVVEDTIGCPSDTSCINIQIFAKPAIFSSPGFLCATDTGLTTTFTVLGAGIGSTYSWSLSPDFSLITSSNSDSSVIVVKYPAGVPGTYNFISIVHNGATGCTDTVTTTYQVVQGLNMTLTNSSKICRGDSITLIATNANSFVWTASPSYPFIDSALSSQIVSPTSTTIFTVVGKIGLCSQTLKDTVTVNPKPAVSVSNDSTVCPNSTVLLNAIASGGVPAYTYLWTPSSDLDNPNIPNPIANVKTAGTYCVTARDSNNCISNSRCVGLNIFPKLTVVSLPSIICATDTNRQGLITVTGASPGSSFQWFLSANYSLITSSNTDSSLITATFPINISATYSFTVISFDAVTGCIDTITKLYTVTPGLNINVTGNNTICFGKSTTLTASGAPVYSWSASPSYSFLDSSAKIQMVSPTVTTQFTLIGTNGICNQKITFTVIVNPKPDAVVAPIPPFCGCTTVNLTGSSTLGVTYSWVSTGGNPIANINLQNTTSPICVTDSFVLFVTDPSTGCSDTASAKAIHLPSPAAIFTLAPNRICPMTSTTILLDGTGSNTTSGTTYLWTSDNPGAFFADSTALITTATINTSTIFHLTVKNILGCDSIISDTVFIYSPPSVTAFNPLICASDIIKESNLVITGASPGSTFTWDSIPSCATPLTANTSSQLFDFSFCSTGTYPFYITVTDSATGCINQINQSVTIVPGVILTSTGNISICEGDSATLSAGGANSYLWFPTNETTSSITIGGLTAAASPYQYIVEGTIGLCSTNDTLIVTVNPVPHTDTIQGSTFVCARDSNLLYTVTPSGGNYTWAISNGIILSGQNSDSLLVQWDTAGTGTLTVIDTNSFSCPGNLQSITVTINPLPIITAIIGPDTVCLNNTITYNVPNHAGAIYNWNVTGGTLIGSAILDSASILWNTPGVGYLTVFETSTAGCTSSVTEDTVYIFPIPLTPSITGNQNVCEGDTMQLYSVTPDSTSMFFWDVTGGIIAGGQGNDSLFINWGTAGTGTASVVHISQYGCPSDTGIISVLINTHPTASVTPDSITMCRNTSVTLTGIVNNGSIQWITSGTGIFGNDTLASTTYTAGATDSGRVVLTMLVNTPFCGSDSDSVIVTVNPPPSVSVSALPSVICAGDTATLIATGGGTYSWLSPSATTDTITVSPTITTTYTVAVYNSFNCTDTGTVVLNVNPVPLTDSIKGPVSVCVNDSNVLYVVTPSGGNYTWTISNGTILSGINSDSVYVKWDTAGTGILTVIDTNSFGCHGVLQTLTATINALPIVSNIAGPDTVCENSFVVYTVTNHPGSSFNWSVNGGAIIGSTNLDTLRVQWGATGTGYLIVNEISNTGCVSDTVRDTVYIFSVPSLPLITGNTALCEGDTMQLYTTTPDSASTFVWNVTGGIIASGQGKDSLFVNWGTSGSGIITVLDISQHGCTSDTGLINVIINPVPVVSVQPDSATICRNLILPLTGNVNTGTIKWTTTGSGTFNNDTIASPAYTPAVTDSGRIVLMLISASTTCGSDTDSVIVNIIPSPVVTLTAASAILCFGDTTVLFASGGGTYSWLPGGETTDSIVISPSVTTIYSVIVNNSFNCPASASITIVVIPPGTPDAGGDAIACRNDSVFLNGSVLNAGGLMWSTLGDGSFTDVLSPSPIYVPGAGDTLAGSVTFVLSATGSCLNLTDTITITFGGVPFAYAGPDTTISSAANNGTIVALNGTSMNGGTIRWTTTGSGTFLPNDSVLATTYTLSTADFNQDSIIITLTVTGPCGTTFDFLIIDFPLLTIPNVFTPYPNTPGQNDFFQILHLPPSSKLKIWDRWGLLVYTSDNYLNDWDAHGLTADEFYYILETREKKYHGWIHVIR